MSSLLDRISSFDWNKYYRKSNFVAGMEALVIANSFLLIGISIYQLTDATILIILLSLGADLGIISIGFLWIAVISDPVGMMLLISGWAFAGIYAKKKYGDKATSILLRGSAIPVLMIIFTIGVVVFALLFSPGGILLAIPILLFLGLLFLLSAIMTFMGVIIAQFIGFTESYDFDINIETDYLVLPVVPQDEKVEHCPFRSNLPGCSYLGYKAPDAPLICDYKSTFLRCRVYAHIYESLEEIEE